MDYLAELKYHFKPKKGWVNDPNGLVYFNGYYHVFYQHAPNFEHPWHEGMHWGHARTKDFLEWEELPVALYPDAPYDEEGCWSGTAIVKDGRLYVVYSSVYKEEGNEKASQTVSVAYSDDGISFKKYENNPVIKHYPSDGGPDFRDPAVAYINGEYYCVMASGNPELRKARLLLYRSDDLLEWSYVGVCAEWDSALYAECPSIMQTDDGVLLTASVCYYDYSHFFCVMYGELENGKFTVNFSGSIDKGPDQYAGQAFNDCFGRQLLIAWIPGWDYAKFAERNIGCMSLPRELKLKNGRVYAYPPRELWHLLKDSDESVRLTEDGFTVERSHHAPVVYKGKINDLKILRDGYVLEVFINGGEEIYTVIL